MSPTGEGLNLFVTLTMNRMHILKPLLTCLDYYSYFCITVTLIRANAFRSQERLAKLCEKYVLMRWKGKRRTCPGS